MKMLVGIGVGVLALGILGYKYLKGYSSKIVTETKGRIHKFKLGGIILSFDTLIKNLSNEQIEFTHPVVIVNYKNQYVASSNVVNKIITVPASGEYTILDTRIEISYIRLLGAAVELIKGFANADKKVSVDLDIKTSLVKQGVKIPIPLKEIVTIG